MAKNSEGAIALRDILPAIDKKNYKFWDTLTAAQKKDFSTWLYMRYTSAVKSEPDMMRYYLMSTNLTLNKNFSAVKNHPQLVYYLMCAASPGLGTETHQWLPPGKKGKANKRTKIFSELYPTYSDAEIEILEQINTDEDLMEHLLDSGWTDNEIKAAFKSFDE